MARIFVTGSSDGLGLLAARRLAERGHEVTLHARNERRAQDARTALPEAHDVLVGDLGSLAQTRALAEDAGAFDAVIHNAGIYLLPERAVTEDGLASVFQVNVLAPYVLTALMPPARRLVYLTSGMALGAPRLDDLGWATRRWSASGAYAESKLLDVALMRAVARRRPGAFVNAVNPGWVPTKMGGASAPDDLELGADTQVWLTAGEDPAADVTGRVLFHRADQDLGVAADERLQEELVAACAGLSGVELR